ncbi:DUF309 domain-containing protein [Paenibacillus guangzhouensis]|uniref:DUF309 domain-containing protein n=1 Tax=Paenibacillus guangzhouensis TaxID=1473112 RepID=UPI0012670963|nr:DUF309 domain-containing protein [Paenibacillus guangzhouensis]
MMYDPLYIQFLIHFNWNRDYYECHEVMEELWLEEGRHPLCQGLLQIAVGLYHFENGNVQGSRKLFTAGIEKLVPYPEQILGIHLGRLVREARQYVLQLECWEQAPFPFYHLTIQIEDAELLEVMTEVQSMMEEFK